MTRPSLKDDAVPSGFGCLPPNVCPVGMTENPRHAPKENNLIYSSDGLELTRQGELSALYSD